MSEITGDVYVLRVVGTTTETNYVAAYLLEELF
jgi:hypothetical protein